MCSLQHVCASSLSFQAASLYYVDEAYCYRWYSVVCLSVSVGRSVTIVSPAKTAEPIKMPFVLWTQMGPRNDCCIR